MYAIVPEKLNDSGRLLTCEELFSFQNIEDAKTHIVEKEVETVLRKSHIEQIEWMEKKLDTPLKKLDAWPTFVELTERRNLFAHADGKVSEHYMNVCSSNSHKLPEGLKVGDVLTCNTEYFGQAHAAVFEVGVKLAHVLWRKLLPKDTANAANSLGNTAYELITDGRHKLAIILLEFFNLPTIKHANDESRRRVAINLAQAYKWNGESAACERIINAEDWSASSDLFKLAVAVLKDDFKGASSIVRKIGKNSELDPNHYRDWPLFKEARLNPDFQQAYFDVFGEQLEGAEIEVAPPEGGTTS